MATRVRSHTPEAQVLPRVPAGPPPLARGHWERFLHAPRPLQFSDIHSEDERDEDMPQASD